MPPSTMVLSEKDSDFMNLRVPILIRTIIDSFGTEFVILGVVPRKAETFQRLDLMSKETVILVVVLLYFYIDVLMYVYFYEENE